MLLNVNGVVRIATETETRFTQAGKQITSFSVVSGDKYKTQTGETKEESCFIKATAFGGLAKVISDYCRKGSQIYIIASLKQDKWEDQQGNKKSMHSLKIESLQMLGNKDDNQSGGYNNVPSGESYSQPAPSYDAPAQNAHASQPAPQAQIPEIDMNSDEIPF